MPVYQTYIVDSVLLDISAIIVKVLVGDFKEPVGAFSGTKANVPLIY